jgi:hypothetical protein
VRYKRNEEIFSIERFVMVRTHREFRIAVLCASLGFVTAGLPALALATPLPAPQDQSAQPDNSAQNKAHSVTADQQTNAAGDRELTRQIRKSIIADHSLSMYGHNVKILVLNGAVTLKGPVHTEDEKKKIGELAVQAAGSPDKVTNNLTVKAE